MLLSLLETQQGTICLLAVKTSSSEISVRLHWSPKGPANSHPSVGCGTERDRHCPAQSGAGGTSGHGCQHLGGDHLPPLKAKWPIPVGTEGLRQKMFLNVSIVCPWKNKPEVLGRARLVLGQWRTYYACLWAPVQISASRGTWPGVTSSVLHENVSAHGPWATLGVAVWGWVVPAVSPGRTGGMSSVKYPPANCALFAHFFRTSVNSQKLKRLLMVLFSAGCETRAGGYNQPYLLRIELIHSGLYLLSS